MPQFNKLITQADQLLLFRDVFQDDIGQIFLSLLRRYSMPGLVSEEIGATYAKVFSLLTAEAEFYQGEIVGDFWQNHLLDRILNAVNPFSRKAGFTMAASTLAAARRDLNILRKFFILSSTIIAEETRRALEEPTLPGWDHFDPASATPQEGDSLYVSFKRRFAVSADWGILAEELAEYYATTGVDSLSRYMAFRWQRNTQSFAAVEQVDPIRLEELIGYEREQAAVIQNTQQFLADLPANNVLLYGARGTGKSSTIKGLLNRYGTRGLRLIEVHKDWLSDYAEIVKQVRGRREKFILFVDDLSFEAEEVLYKDLKAMLEGSVEARPSNLLIYATSNRRHLIKEQFSDNPGAGLQDEIAAWDTVEEKLSLSDRFGLMITFAAPGQQKYLEIVYALAARAEIDLEQEVLKRRALQWELSHSGRSGRVARQFVDSLIGQLGLQKL